MRLGLLMIIALTASAFPPAPVDRPAPKGYVAVRARAPIVVDGKLDDPSWADAPWTDDFADIEGGARPLPRFRTRAKMLWDDKSFYIAAELSESHVWGTLTKHDSVIFRDNDFEVFIDPDGDNHDYGELEINALNTEWDLLLKKPYRDGGPAVDAWEVPGLLKGVHVDGTINDPTDVDRAWTVELAIPWEVLGALNARRKGAPADGDQWRVNFSRVEWEHTVEAGKYVKVPNRPEANWVWSPQGVVNMHCPEHWGYVQFSAEPPGVAKFRPDPNSRAREKLMRIYEAQAAYHKEKKAWAPTLESLGIKPEEVEGEGPIAIKLTKDGYEASIKRAEKVVKVRQDSLITID